MGESSERIRRIIAGMSRKIEANNHKFDGTRARLYSQTGVECGRIFSIRCAHKNFVK